MALKTHLSSALQSGYYLKAPAPKEGEAAPAAPNPLTDPGAMDGMMEMMKKQAVQFIPQVSTVPSRRSLAAVLSALPLMWPAVAQQGKEADPVLTILTDCVNVLHWLLL